MSKTNRSNRDEIANRIANKAANKMNMARRGARFENLNPSFTKKGPGRYHVQGK